MKTFSIQLDTFSPNYQISRGVKINTFAFHFCELDQEEVAKDLQENFPIIRDNFDVLSKVGEGIN